jgi:isochorismate synthase EntC
MLSQAFVQLDDIQMDSFFHRAVIQQEFAGDAIWLGFGDDSQGEVTFFNENFFHTKKQSYTPAYVAKTNREDFLKWMQPFKQDFILEVEQNLDHEYLKDVAQIQKWIHQKRIQKMVAITTESYSKPCLFNPITMAYNCLSNMPGTFYSMWDNNFGIVGMTPEPLFVCDKKQCYTFALAGTISTENSNYQETLLQDPKELSEHQMVIDDIKLKLNSTASKTFKIDVEPTQLLNYGTIAHLKTKINFDVSTETNTMGLVETLSPTAALGGFPKVSANSLLKKTQHYKLIGDERFFGGTVGLEYPGFTQALVAIRNIQWNEQKVWIESGSGIVAQSDANKELVEVQNKRNAVKKFFT